MSLPEGLHWRSTNFAIYLENEDEYALITLDLWYLPGNIILTLDGKKVESYLESAAEYKTWVEHLFMAAVLVPKTKVVSLQLNT